MRRIAILGVSAALAALSSGVFAADRRVPSQYPTIQAGINAAVNGDTVVVADGLYTGAGNRGIDFKGKAITVRSENGPDSCIIDCQHATGHRGFYFHSGEGPNSVVSGLTIKRGKITGSPGVGGGIYCSGSSPTIQECLITNNVSVGANSGFPGDSAYGGGIYCSSASHPEIIGCTIGNNRARAADGAMGPWFSPYSCGDGGSAYGGGVCCSSAVIKDCTISENTVRGGNGGGDYDCSEGGNGGDGRGGGIYGDATIHNCSISDNRAVGGDDCFCIGGSAIGGNGIGGGVYGASTASITNCTIVNNTAVAGGDPNVIGPAPLSAGGGVAGTPLITNCIVWGNTAMFWPQVQLSPFVAYSNVQGGISGTGNIDADPLFVAGPLGDYYLKHIWAGQFIDSPCVDAGSDLAVNLGLDTLTTRTDGEPDTGVVDMGFHYRLTTVADLNGDGCVDGLDFAILGYQWRQAPGVPSADIDPPWGDELVDEYDLSVLVGKWLWCQ